MNQNNYDDQLEKVLDSLKSPDDDGIELRRVLVGRKAIDNQGKKNEAKVNKIGKVRRIRN